MVSVNDKSLWEKAFEKIMMRLSVLIKLNIVH